MRMDHPSTHTDPRLSLIARKGTVPLSALRTRRTVSAHLRSAGWSEQEGGHGERMSIARLGRKKAGWLQRRHLRARQIAHRRRRRAAGSGTGRTAGPAVTEVASRMRQFQEGRRGLGRSMWIIGIRTGIGRIAARAGGRFVFGQQQCRRLRQRVRAVLRRQRGDRDVSRPCLRSTEKHRGGDGNRSQHELSARRTHDPTLYVPVEGTPQVGLIRCNPHAALRRAPGFFALSDVKHCPIVTCVHRRISTKADAARRKCFRLLTCKVNIVALS